VSLLVAEVVPYQTTPTEPKSGPVSSHGIRDVRVSVPSLTRTRGLHVAPLFVECRR
jgi:hypothetical protein